MEIVLNTQFGGFSICKEMAEWLIAEGWNVISEEEFDWSNRHKYPVKSFVNGTFGYSPCRQSNDIELRSDFDLIRCVKYFHDLNKNKDLPYYKRRSFPAGCLEIFNVDIHIDICDVHDGKEEISCWASVQESNRE